VGATCTSSVFVDFPLASGFLMAKCNDFSMSVTWLPARWRTWNVPSCAIVKYTYVGAAPSTSAAPNTRP
jgi:hypothetical protein